MSPSVYVGRLPPDAQKADVEDHFKPFGRVVDVRLMSNFGFVEFENPDDVDNAIRELDGREFLGERLIVERPRESRKRDVYDGARPARVPRGRGVRVDIIGISPTTSWQDLKDFGRQGNETVTYADVDRETGNGVIEFPTMADAEDAIRRLDGAEIQGVPVKLQISTAPSGGGGYGGGYDRPPPRDYGRPRYDDRRGGGGRYDDRPPRFDDRRGGYDDRPRYDDRPPRSDRYDDRPPRQDRYDDRYDDRRGGYGGGRDRSPPRRERDYPPRDREPREERAPRESREPREAPRDFPPREERDYPAPPPREEREFVPRD